MTHANAALTPRHRVKVARLVVDDGYSISEVAACSQVSWPTVKRWVDRYAAGESMLDRSSRPKTSPARTSRTVTKRCVSLRMRLREGPVQLAARLGIAPSTVHRILTTARLNRLSYVDRATGEPIRRYEHPHPGSLVHVDVKKLGNIPDGGGWRYVGRRQGEKNRAATPGKPRNQYGGPKLGYAFVHTVIDDYSRVAYTEVHDDETAITAVAVLHRAVEWFADRGVTIERVLSDNGGAYRSHLWRDTCEALSITPKRTRPYRPQTNGKVERFHRTMADGWAYARCYRSEQERRDALGPWLRHYNFTRPHTACCNLPPASRLAPRSSSGVLATIDVKAEGLHEDQCGQAGRQTDGTV
ncbi:IS481 family transposase [Arsenicicoccus dermatophilus]|uniref:IS481 family transposase n=1 Tax=Arsenicicoccus dermatophilus TaxID=1076331 RepID=UPI0039172F7B